MYENYDDPQITHEIRCINYDMEELRFKPFVTDLNFNYTKKSKRKSNYSRTNIAVWVSIAIIVSVEMFFVGKIIWQWLSK